MAAPRRIEVSDHNFTQHKMGLVSDPGQIIASLDDLMTTEDEAVRLLNPFLADVGSESMPAPTSSFSTGGFA